MSTLFPDPPIEAATPDETLDGVVDRVVYANEQTAWCVVRLRVRGRREKVTAVGSLFGVQPGETLRLRGRWAQNRKYGEQFEVGSYTPVLPSTVAGIRRYLGSGLVNGIGPALADRLVNRFGDRTLEVLDSEPERLTEVQGIGPVRSERIQKAWRQQRAVHEVMVFLQGHGVSAAYAVRIWRRFGDQAVSVVRTDPYRLALEVHGIGFRIADSVASSLGIRQDAPARLAAGLLHALSQGTDRGHLYLPRGRLIEEATTLLEVPPPRIEEALDGLVRDRSVVEVPLAGRATGVYQRFLFDAESEIVSHLERLLGAGAPRRRIDVEPSLARFESRETFRLAAGQREAISRVLASPIAVVTGGPGTGKTTLVRGLLRLELDAGSRVELAAPTGRAAQRLSEATDAPARTLHRLLEYHPREMRFQRNHERPLECDLLVVDEASMIDVPLFRDLLEALPTGARLLLVGDVEQLPSVGPGRVLGDLIDSDRFTVLRLTEIHRQAQQSHIVTNAHRIQQGRLPELSSEPGSDFYFIHREDPEAVLSTLEELVSRRIPRSFGFDPRVDLQVLTPMRRGQLGTRHLNSLLQERLNPSGESLTRGARTLRVGDKVMQTRNNYQLEVFNGDIGRITRVDGSELTLEVAFEDRRILYEASDLDDLILAYACSIHKSQGSEYPAVVLILHSQHYVMLERNLLYTAVTRGRRLVVVLGNRRALAVAVRNTRREQRLTRLASLLAKAG